MDEEEVSVGVGGVRESGNVGRKVRGVMGVEAPDGDVVGVSKEGAFMVG